MAGRCLKSGSNPIDEYAFEMWWNLRLEWESQEAGSATGTASDSLTAASRTGLDRLAAVAASEVESPVKSMVASETPLAKVLRGRRTPRAPLRLQWSESSEKSGDDFEHLEASQRTPQASQPLAYRDTGRKGSKRGRSLISTVSPAIRTADAAASVPKKAKKDSRIQNFAMKVISLIGNGSVKESFIRGSCGNNPDVSKALRVLVSEKRVLRIGTGGRSDPFRYKMTEGQTGPSPSPSPITSLACETGPIPEPNALPPSGSSIVIGETVLLIANEEVEISQPHSYITSASTQDQPAKTPFLCLEDTPDDVASTEPEEIDIDIL